MSPSAIPTRNSYAVSTARTPRLGLTGSLLLHVAIIGAAFFSWSHTLDIADESPPVVPVDLVTIGENTNIAAMMEKPTEAQADEKFEPPQLDEVKAPEILQNEAAPSPLQASSEQTLTKQPAPALPKIKPRLPPEVAKEKFDINNIVALLDKRQAATNAPKNARLGNRTIQGVGAQNAMTMDLEDALRNQISQCWSPPVGAPHPDQLIVSFKLFLNPNGSVAQPPQLVATSGGSAGDPYMRAAAEAARRAVYTCAPYRLPAARYEQWREITFIFDPRKMVGQ